jgi:phage terminase large subunit GpA-like protein
VNNLFVTTADLAAEEWQAGRSVDEDNAERELRQFVWCLPVVPSKLAQTNLEAHELAGRMADLPKGVVPEDAEYFTAGIDLGKYLAHWVVVAWSPQARGHIVEYGRLEVPSDNMGVEQALMVTLREFRELIQAGWPVAHAEAEKRISPTLVFADSGYMAPVVYAFCRESGEPFRPAAGRGASQQHRQWYNRPTQGGASTVNWLGEASHAVWLAAEQVRLVEMDADYWKTWVHQRLVTPIGSPGAMTLYRAPAQDHLSLAKHLTAEVKTEEFVAGKGVVTKWERVRKQNHWLDALYNSCVAGYGTGVRLVDEVVPQVQARESEPA